MDAELVIRAQRGDQAAFAEIASGTYGRLHSLAYGILRDRTLAEDAVQQSMLDAWRNLSKLRDPARFDAWSYRLTVYDCIM
jgi:RNA polymerase sigma-70 factor (ECF subfamily)